MMIASRYRRTRTCTAITLLLVTIALSGGSAALAQGVESEKAIDAIVGSQVHEEEARAAAEPGKVIAAIEKTQQSTETVRTVSKLDSVDIVYLPDAAKAEGGPPPPIEAKIEEHKSEITELRDEIEGNAMLYHAINSRQILVEDVLAVEFDKPDRVVIYAATKPPAK